MYLSKQGWSLKNVLHIRIPNLLRTYVLREYFLNYIKNHHAYSLPIKKIGTTIFQDCTQSKM